LTKLHQRVTPDLKFFRDFGQFPITAAAREFSRKAVRNDGFAWKASPSFLTAAAGFMP
jgi:hypothetical protein